MGDTLPDKGLKSIASRKGRGAMKAASALAVTTVPIVLIAATVAARQQTMGNQREQSYSTTIELPDRWVPFSARIVNTDPAGNVQYGKLYRGSDGSNTTIMRSADGEQVITIHHFPSRRTFAKLGKQGWIVNPFPTGKSTLPKRTLRAATSRLKQLDVLVAGAPVYELASGVKRSRWAVGLNGFTIYTLDSNGSTFELMDIVVGEPHADVFMPPADAKPVTMKREEVFTDPPSER
jgi:hypothetical protein